MSAGQQSLGLNVLLVHRKLLVVYRTQYSSVRTSGGNQGPPAASCATDIGYIVCIFATSI